MNTIERDSARAQAQEAFVGLLATPLLAARIQPAVFAAILRHRAVVGDWAARLGYRLVIAGSVVRLHRDPAGPGRTAAPPAWDPPARRDLVLLALAAAACEDTDSSTTVQELSDEVRALSAGTRVTGYDPDRRAERQAFVRGLDRLAELGILIRRTSDETLLRQWEEEGTGVGAGYEVDRDALLQFTDPYTVERALAADPPDAGDDQSSRVHTRSQRLLRILVEDTALLYADLHPLDAEYARGQRSWLAGQAADMTGGTVETRAEGMLLQMPEDRPTTAAVTPVFPAATAGRWFALKVLDASAAEGEPDASGRIVLAGAQVDAAVTRTYTGNFRALTNEIRESPARLRSVVERILAGLGLIRTSGDGWIIVPLAGRYRDPKAVWEPVLEEIR
ncbi:MAG: DUF2398 family protein [Streptosporangiaceae bacterium]